MGRKPTTTVVVVSVLAAIPGASAFSVPRGIGIVGNKGSGPCQDILQRYQDRDSRFGAATRNERYYFQSGSPLPERRLSHLLATKKDDDSPGEGVIGKFLAWRDEMWAKLVALFPSSLVAFVSNVWDRVTSLVPKLALAFAGFFVGVVLSVSLIFVPITTSFEKLSQPVTLFETILADLDYGYVDPVDTNKLFETGVSAMLRSLDPYTEFEAKEEAQQLNEGIMGKYGGVGLVISGATPKDAADAVKEAIVVPPIDPVPGAEPSKLLPKEAIKDKASGPDVSSVTVDEDDEDAADALFELQNRRERDRAVQKARDKGIRVVTAFEGYAFDYGLRVGDKLISIDDKPITGTTSVEDVRNMLRGQPGTLVTVNFEREGVEGVQTVTMPRSVVQIRDVKLATFIGKPQDGIGYISLSGFASNAGQEMRQAIFSLTRAAEEASGGENGLQGLILDLRGNPGGLLTSAVDVSSLLLPKGSDIVSAKGRGFPGVLYRSRVDPILSPNTKLAVLVNQGTASAAEIVSGAIQDLDVGIIVGGGRTFGKGLVQNVEELPYDTALKFTVAKYYTPSGRCIQGINYKEGGGLKAENGKYQSTKVANEDRQIFYTKSGRVVKDGGGIEADFKVPAPKASALEITLLRSEVFTEYAAKWSRTHELTNNFEVDESTYRDFQNFVQEKQKSGDIKLESLYAGALNDLKRALTQSGYKGSQREVEQLQASIVREVQRDFDKFSKDIKEDIANSILSRYLPESMLLERNLKTDSQVNAAAKLLGNRNKFDQLLAKGSQAERLGDGGAASSTIDMASEPQSSSGIAMTGNGKISVKW